MKKFLSLVLALVMTFSLVTVSAGAKDFTDDAKITYSEAVDVLTSIKVIDGYTDGSFNPAGNITRGAAAKIICNLVLGPTNASVLSADAKPFSDVATTNVFAGYITYCASKGIINGYADGTFKPANNVTGFQFLKMLLGALGYDSEIEQFTGANWSIQVAKLASSLNLTKGNDAFVGTKAATREEACLYAFNTLKATMVEYDTRGTVINLPGGGSITQGASKPTEVANKGWDYRDPDPANTDTLGTMQFCEQYFKDLKLDTVANVDAFGRPASTWYNKLTKIGTYAIDATKSYTVQTKISTIYTDLGLSSGATGTAADYYIDGHQESNLTIKKGDTATKVGGNGTLTEVFNQDGTLTVVCIKTYAAKVSSVTAATASKDRYVSVAGMTFETENFKSGDLVTYTRAAEAHNDTVYTLQSVTALDKAATATMTGYTSAKAITAGGTTYKANATFTDVNGIQTNGYLKNDVDVYVDQYGYMVYLDAAEATSNYAVVVGLGNQNLFGTSQYGCTLVLADGTKVTGYYDADKSTTKYGASPNDTAANLSEGDIVSYTKDAEGVYKLIVKGGYATGQTVSATNGKSQVTLGGETLYTNSNTLYVVRTGSTPYTYTVYTGYAAAPSIAATSAAGLAYVKNSTKTNQVDIVYVDSAVVSTSESTIFVALKRGADLTSSTNENGDEYYEVPAVVGGAVSTLKLDIGLFKSSPATNEFDSDFAANYVLSSITTVDGIVTSVVKATPETGVGTVASDGTVVGLDATYDLSGKVIDGTYFAYTASTEVYYVGTDKVISASSVDGVQNDLNDTVQYVLNDNNKTVKAIYIQAVDNGSYALTHDTDLTKAGVYDNAACTADDAVTTGTSVAAGTTLYIKLTGSFTSVDTTVFTKVSGTDNAVGAIYSFVMPGTAYEVTDTLIEGA